MRQNTKCTYTHNPQWDRTVEDKSLLRWLDTLNMLPTICTELGVAMYESRPNPKLVGFKNSLLQTFILHAILCSMNIRSFSNWRNHPSLNLLSVNNSFYCDSLSTENSQQRTGFPDAIKSMTVQSNRVYRAILSHSITLQTPTSL